MAKDKTIEEIVSETEAAEAAAKIDPNEDENHPVRKPTTVFSVGEEVLTPDGVTGKIIQVEGEGSAAKYAVVFAATKTFNEADLSKPE